MVRLRRRLLRDTLLLGVTLTLAVVAVDQGHGLSSLENWAYDRRAAAFQYFTPPPTDKLVHLDIDDRALDVIGRWPWSRSTLAELLNEIHLAGPKVIAMDIVFSEPEKVRYEPDDPSQPDGKVHPLKPDDLLTQSFKNCGNIILPIVVGNLDPSPPIDREIEFVYRTDLESPDTAVTDHLAASGFSKSEIAKAVGGGHLLSGRRAAAYWLVLQSLKNKNESLEQIKHRLLKSVAAHGVEQWNSPTTRLLDEAYSADMAFLTARGFGIPFQPSQKVLTVETFQSAPLAQFGKVIRDVAFVDHQFAGNPIVRDSPLLIGQGDRAFLQLGLAMACQMLEVNQSAIRLEGQKMILPLPDGMGEIDVPIRTVVSVHRVPAVMYVPWFGTSDWTTMYDWPNHGQSRQHMSANEVWDICQTRHHIEDNNRNADKAISVLLQNDQPYKIGLSVERGDKYFATTAPLDQTSPRREMGQFALGELKNSGLEETFAEMAKTAALKPAEQHQREEMLAAKASLEATLAQNEKLERQLDSLRAKLRQALNHRAVLIGLTPSSSTTDVVTTSLHDRTPGVIVHGAIFNAIMTRHFWRQAPAWGTVTITLLLGLGTAIITAWLSPVPAMLVSVLLLLGYILLNGLLLFDHYGLVVGLAGPIVAIAVVWAGCVMLQTILEGRERRLVTRRLGAYVDPTLVDYVLENPDKVKLEGEIKELTVVFTDLANFTTLSEKLGEKSVALLNDYMAQMVPIIRNQRGYVNKFLGDGIMCFYGAPRENATHAADAISTALQMQQVMQIFNHSLAQKGLTQLAVRVGISTGRMVVGDAGPGDRSDYTVLGDAVNLGARLESANKYLGTRILMTARTAELAGDSFVFCPVGKLRVVGKTEGVAVLEGVGVGEVAPELKHRMCLTTRMVEAFQAAKFQECITAADELAKAFSDSVKLANLYRDAAEKYVKEGAPADFDGSISLAEK